MDECRALSFLFGLGVGAHATDSAWGSLPPRIKTVVIRDAALSYRLDKAKADCRGYEGFEHITISSFVPSNWQVWCFSGRIYSEPSGQVIVP